MVEAPPDAGAVTVSPLEFVWIAVLVTVGEFDGVWASSSLLSTHADTRPSTATSDTRSRATLDLRTIFTPGSVNGRRRGSYAARREKQRRRRRRGSAVPPVRGPRYPCRTVIRALSGQVPHLGPGAFVHEAAEVIGRVTLGARSSVWPRAVIRGDTEDIRVGEDTNVQDGAVLHADPGFPCTLGARVTVGHLACVHGCAVGDEALIGIGAVVLNGARIGAGSIVGAGAVVAEGVEIPEGSMVLGVPGRVVRPLSAGEREGLRASAARYVGMIEVHR